MTEKNHTFTPAQGTVNSFKAIADDCREAAQTYRFRTTQSLGADSVAQIYERIADSIDRALAAQPPAAPVSGNLEEPAFTRAMEAFWDATGGTDEGLKAAIIAYGQPPAVIGQLGPVESATLTAKDLPPAPVEPSVEAMKAAVELEIYSALGRVQTVEIGRMIQKAIDASRGISSDGTGENQPEQRTGPHREGGETNSGATGDSELTRSARLPSDPQCSAGNVDDPYLTPTRLVDDLLSACDPSNWDSERNKGARYRGLHDAYTAIHEIVGEYQVAMYEWTRLRTQPQTARVSVLDDELLIEWGRPDVAISIDDDGFGYAIRRGNQFEPGVAAKWSGAVAEIRTALALSRPERCDGANDLEHLDGMLADRERG